MSGWTESDFYDALAAWVTPIIDQAHDENVSESHREGFCKACAENHGLLLGSPVAEAIKFFVERDEKKLLIAAKDRAWEVIRDWRLKPMCEDETLAAMVAKVVLEGTE